MRRGPSLGELTSAGASNSQATLHAAEEIDGSLGYSYPDFAEEGFSSMEEQVKVTRYPMSMTGRKLRKKLGIEEKIPKQIPFLIARRYRKIPPETRLSYLQYQANRSYGILLTWKELWNHRRGFNQHKVRQFGLGPSTLCWCCQKNKAEIRHHVQPLLKGGRNKVNNIVPLCKACHGEVHPHLGGR